MWPPTAAHIECQRVMPLDQRYIIKQKKSLVTKFKHRFKHQTMLAWKSKTNQYNLSSRLKWLDLWTFNHTFKTHILHCENTQSNTILKHTFYTLKTHILHSQNTFLLNRLGNFSKLSLRAETWLNDTLSDQNLSLKTGLHTLRTDFQNFKIVSESRNLASRQIFTFFQTPTLPKQAFTHSRQPPILKTGLMHTRGTGFQTLRLVSESRSVACWHTSLGRKSMALWRSSSMRHTSELFGFLAGQFFLKMKNFSQESGDSHAGHTVRFITFKIRMQELKEQASTLMMSVQLTYHIWGQPITNPVQSPHTNPECGTLT